MTRRSWMTYTTSPSGRTARWRVAIGAWTPRVYWTWYARLLRGPGYGGWCGAAAASEQLYPPRPPMAADEALRQARIDPQRPVASLATRERAISTTRFGWYSSLDSV